jgi:hypothetical protein
VTPPLVLTLKKIIAVCNLIVVSILKFAVMNDANSSVSICSCTFGEFIDNFWHNPEKEINSIKKIFIKFFIVEFSYNNGLN